MLRASLLLDLVCHVVRPFLFYTAPRLRCSSRCARSVGTWVLLCPSSMPNLGAKIVIRTSSTWPPMFINFGQLHLILDGQSAVKLRAKNESLRRDKISTNSQVLQNSAVYSKFLGSLCATNQKNWTKREDPLKELKNQWRWPPQLRVSGPSPRPTCLDNQFPIVSLKRSDCLDECRDVHETQHTEIS